MVDLAKAPEAATYDRARITDWRPEDEKFWESKGKKIALRNLIWSMFALHHGFAIWLIWSIVVTRLPAGRLSLHHGPTLYARSDTRTVRLAGPFPVRLLLRHFRRPQLDRHPDRVAFHPLPFARLFGDAARHSVVAYDDLSGDRWVWRRHFLRQHEQHVLLLPRPPEGYGARLERRRGESRRQRRAVDCPAAAGLSASSIFTWQPPPRAASISRTPDCCGSRRSRLPRSARIYS